MTQHTPGPWIVSESRNGPVVGVSHPQLGYVIIAKVVGVAPENPKANARLIAAAPDLLSALQQLHDNIAEYARINNLGGFENQDMQQARAAIRKATQP